MKISCVACAIERSGGYGPCKINNGERFVELDRGQLSYASLRSQTERRTKQQGQWFLKAGHLPISNDQELATAVLAAEASGAHYLEVQLQGGSAPKPVHTPQPVHHAPPPSHSAQPVYQAPPSTYQPPQQAYVPPPQQAYVPPPQQAYVPPPVHTPVQTSGPSGLFTSFDVYGSPSAPADKPTVTPNQLDDGYEFTPVICKNAYHVDVTIEPVNAESSAIKFRLSRESGAATQTFKLGFSFGLEHCVLTGNVVRVNFPF